jgi:hypothetical protein
MILAVVFVGGMCSVLPDDFGRVPKEERPRYQAKVALQERRAEMGYVEKPAYTREELRPYKKISRQNREDIEAGYDPPPFGEEDEGEAQARVLSNCRAGFTHESAPGDGT